jgi:beta-lactam-binding protein with PASTA domain
MLVVPRAVHGVVPNVVGLKLTHARTKLEKAKLTTRVVRFAKGKPGRVIAQRPRAGAAGGQHLEVRLIVGRIG